MFCFPFLIFLCCLYSQAHYFCLLVYFLFVFVFTYLALKKPLLSICHFFINDILVINKLTLFLSLINTTIFVGHCLNKTSSVLSGDFLSYKSMGSQGTSTAYKEFSLVYFSSVIFDPLTNKSSIYTESRPPDEENSVHKHTSFCCLQPSPIYHQIMSLWHCCLIQMAFLDLDLSSWNIFNFILNNYCCIMFTYVSTLLNEWCI